MTNDMNTGTRTAICWRSILFDPATNEKFVTSAMRQPADALQIDLEDSIPPDQKILARELTPQIADRFKAAHYDVIVRVNRAWRMQIRDLEAVIRPSVNAVSLPKVADAAAVCVAAEVIAELEYEARMPQGHTGIIAMIEDAEGLHNMAEIAASHPRVVGIIVGAEDLAVSMQMAVTEDALYVPNVMAVAAARRAGVMPIGFVGSVADFADQDDFRAKVIRARQLGFECGFCIHPTQVGIMNEAFAPQDNEIEHASELISEFNKHQSAGSGAFTFKGRMVDLPVVLQAQALIARHKGISEMEVRRNSSGSEQTR